jgi:hypothetical protein
MKIGTSEKRNRAAAFLAILLTLLCVFSYAAENAGIEFDVEHDCAGEDCFVCFLVRLQEKITDLLQGLAVLASPAFLFASVQGTVLFSGIAHTNRETPVCLKVKLSN